MHNLTLTRQGVKFPLKLISSSPYDNDDGDDGVARDKTNFRNKYYVE